MPFEEHIAQDEVSCNEKMHEVRRQINERLSSLIQNVTDVMERIDAVNSGVLDVSEEEFRRLQNMRRKLQQKINVQKARKQGFCQAMEMAEREIKDRVQEAGIGAQRQAQLQADAHRSRLSKSQMALARKEVEKNAYRRWIVDHHPDEVPEADTFNSAMRIKFDADSAGGEE